MVEYDVPVGGLSLSVRDHAGASPAVVAMHGLASNARWWDLVAPLLAPRRVVAVDLRGHGLSGRPESGYDFDAVAGDVRTLAEALALGPRVAMGHSWGASVALWWAALDEGVRAVVCVDGGVGDLRGFFGSTWDQAAVAMRPPELHGVSEEMLATWVSRSGLAGEGDPAEAMRILRGNFEESADGGLRPRLSVDRHMQIAYALYHLDSASLFARVRVPVLFVLARRGEVDPRAAAVEAALETLPPGSAVRWVEGMHDLPVQRPREVAAAVVEFLGGVGL